MARHCEVIIPEFSVRLRQAIKDRGISQHELARRLDICYDSVNKWCNDNYLPDSGNLKLICEELKVSADYLLELSF